MTRAMKKTANRSRSIHERHIMKQRTADFWHEHATILFAVGDFDITVNCLTSLILGVQSII